MKRIVLCFVIVAVSASAQTRTMRGFVMGAAGGSNGQAAWGTAQIMVPPFSQPTVIGAPFSGEETQRQVQVLADGTRINRPQMPGAKVFRDSEGRTRIERPLFPAPPARPGIPSVAPIEIVEINDPGQGIYYLLDVSKKVAYRLKYTPEPPRNQVKQRAPPRPPTPPPGTPIQGPQNKIEDLGLQIINGVQAQGQRTTTTIPVGFQGNDRPMTQVSENWTAVTLQIPVKSVSTSPQSGESTFDLINVGLASPSPLLFSPPPEYTIQDQQSPFTVEFGQRPAGAMTVITSGSSTVVVGKQ